MATLSVPTSKPGPALSHSPLNRRPSVLRRLIIARLADLGEHITTPQGISSLDYFILSMLSANPHGYGRFKLFHVSLVEHSEFLVALTGLFDRGYVRQLGSATMPV
jgi:hypothetical protein